MTASTRVLGFNGGFLQRGFWLYVWEVRVPHARSLYYVGRTGDTSSINAQSPFNRMGQHLGFAVASNMLRQHLDDHQVKPERCSFRLVAYGPILPEADTRELHRERRDITAALEKALAEALRNAGYEVLNTVKCRKRLDRRRWTRVRKAFAVYFPKLDRPHSQGKTRG
jgi:hypothetical protein